jgi:hypothetical protein
MSVESGATTSKVPSGPNNLQEHHRKDNFQEHINGLNTLRSPDHHSTHRIFAQYSGVCRIGAPRRSPIITSLLNAPLSACRCGQYSLCRHHD